MMMLALNTLNDDNVRMLNMLGYGFVFILLPYLVGSIPFGLILAKLFGYGDIRKIGSGNIGATNVFRTGNKWLAFLTLLLDALKGFLIVFFIYKHGYFNFCGMACDDPTDIKDIFIGGFFLILGHIFSVWLKFKGGKGVATAIGVVFALNPVLGASIMVIWLLTFFISHISSISALVAFCGTTLIALIAALSRKYSISDMSYFYYLLLVTLLIFFTHRANIVRLIKGTEPKMEKKK